TDASRTVHHQPSPDSHTDRQIQWRHDAHHDTWRLQLQPIMDRNLSMKVYIVKSVRGRLVHKKCPKCSSGFKKDDALVKVAGNYRGRQDKIYHQNCYVDAHGSPML